jgi:hypothetical protein
MRYRVYASIGILTLAPSLSAQVEATQEGAAASGDVKVAAGTQSDAATNPDARASTSTTSEQTPSETPQSLTLDLGVGSAYVWRGINLWGPQSDSQNLSLYPSITFARGAFTAFYWGGYQLTGRTKGSNLDAAVGAEQDLGVTYAFPLTEKVSLSLWGTALLWPLADEKVVHTSLPTSFEPGLTVIYASAVTTSFAVSYFRGLTDVTDTYSHVYLAPTVAKDLSLTPQLALNLSVGGGYKFWTNAETRDAGPINHWDVGAHVGATYNVERFYFKPAVHLSKSDIDDDANGLAYWAGINVGYSVAL